jgi:hypothetical protein
MKTLEFFTKFIDVKAHKIEHNLEELDLIRNKTVLVKATTLYQIYKHNVFERDGRLTIRDFYQIAGQYLYYDKYVCKHGTEFYYYVMFNENNPMYQLTKELLRKRIYADRPETLKDLLQVYPAVTKGGVHD